MKATEAALTKKDIDAELSQRDFMQEFLSKLPKVIDFGEHGKDDQDDPPEDSNALAEKALEHQEEQRKKGRTSASPKRFWRFRTVKSSESESCHLEPEPEPESEPEPKPESFVGACSFLREISPPSESK